jgi:POT family proton-dependent oligopeptide transporter
MASDLNMEKKPDDTMADTTSVAEPEARWQGLRRVPDKLPRVALLILAVEVCSKSHPQTLQVMSIN